MRRGKEKRRNEFGAEAAVQPPRWSLGHTQLIVRSVSLPGGGNEAAGRRLRNRVTVLQVDKFIAISGRHATRR